MINYIIKRILLFIPTIIALTIIVFSIVHLAPGDPVQIMFGKNANLEDIEIVRSRYDLDKPIVVQYFLWIKKIMKFDFGKTIVRGDDILPELLQRYPRTLFLTFEAILLSFILAIPLSLLSVKYHNSFLDVFISIISLIFISMPEFWVGLILIIFFGVILKILPTSSHIFGVGFWPFFRASFLPALSLALIIFAGTERMLRSELINNLKKDYILFARIKGASENRALIIHNLKNSTIATTTVIGLQIGYLMGGVVVIERVFGFPGMGQMLLDGIARRDYPVIQACVLVYVLTFVVINLIIDIIYGLLDTRIKYK